MSLDVSTNMLPTMAKSWRELADKREAHGDHVAAGALRLGADAIDEVAILRVDGKALIKEIEKVATTLNEIGWPSEFATATERACRALRILNAERSR